MPATTIRLSVITPTKNRLSLLLETMDSVARQTCADWEHIVVDDGSNDGTEETVRARGAVDGRVRYIPRPGATAGASVCRNVGLAASTGPLVVFLDSDDLLEPFSVERRIAAMDRNLDADFITFQAGVFRSTPGDLGRVMDPELLGDDLLRFLFFECPWQTTAPTWRREALGRLAGFDESLPSWQDVDLHVRALASGCRYLRYPEVDHHVRWQYEPTKVSVEQRVSPRHLEAAARVVEKFERAVKEGPGMTWTRQRALCSLHFLIAEQWMELGRRSEAFRSWGAIRRTAPGSRLLYASGTALLGLSACGRHGRRIGARLAHKWKGWMRLRTNPELVGR